MKKIYIALAVLATAALTSCQEEKSFNGELVGDGDVAFVLKAGPSTRTAELGSPVTKGISVPIGRVGDMSFYLEETITDLSYVSPETRGVPVFTENVGKLYSNKLFVHAAGFGDATFETNGFVDDGWRYTHHYGSKDPWPEDKSAVDFFLRMPSDMTGVTFGNDAYSSGAKTTFTYTSPLTAEAQTDIIFTGISLKESTHKDNLPNGTPVTFYHALTAVKFAIANPSSEISEKGIQVTNISFTGLKNTGTCTVDPSASTKVTWSNTSATTTTEGEGEAAVTKPNVIQQDFVAGDLVEFNTTNNPDFGSSFFNPGTTTTPGTDKQNINTQTASKTFWLVPQAFNGSSAILRISYTINNTPEYMDLNLGEVLTNVEWKPGQLRTYTIRLEEVNVKIDDTIVMEDKSQETIHTPWGDRDFDSYIDSYKEGVTIENTGNTDAFIRAAIIGQWRNVDGNPVFGYTDFTEGIQMVDSWYMDVIVNKTCHQGEFEDLPGNNWTVGEDGYYYYTKVVPANSQIPDSDALFTKYTVGHVPGAAVAGVPQNIYFTLEIATQAISAKKLDGTTWKDSDYATVWQNAINHQ